MHFFRSGSFFIILAALLWASDAPFRKNVMASLSPSQVVFWEHGLALIVLLTAVLYFFRKIPLLRGKDWAAAGAAGAGGSAVATILFTASFNYVDPSLSILLQKLQPVIVVIAAYIFLGERPQRNFYPWAALAFLAAVFLSFPDLRFGSLFSGDNRAHGVLLGLAATFIWAFSTIFGRSLLLRYPVSVVTFWRFAFGFAALCVLVCLPQLSWSGTLGEVETFVSPLTLPGKSLAALVYLGLISGLAGMAAYYRGMASTPANVTTFLELVYPVSAIVINMFAFGTRLSGLEICWAVLLLFAVTMISLQRSTAAQ